MSMWRYNWLRRRGYRTVTGTSYVDPDFGSQWAELVMMKGKKLKRVSVSGGTTVREIIRMEDPRTNGDLVRGAK